MTLLGDRQHFLDIIEQAVEFRTLLRRLKLYLGKDIDVVGLDKLHTVTIHQGLSCMYGRAKGGRIHVNVAHLQSCFLADLRHRGHNDTGQYEGEKQPQDMAVLRVVVG